MRAHPPDQNSRHPRDVADRKTKAKAKANISSHATAGAILPLPDLALCRRLPAAATTATGAGGGVPVYGEVVRWGSWEVRTAAHGVYEGRDERGGEGSEGGEGGDGGEVTRWMAAKTLSKMAACLPLDTLPCLAKDILQPDMPNGLHGSHGPHGTNGSDPTEPSPSARTPTRASPTQSTQSWSPPNSSVTSASASASASTPASTPVSDAGADADAVLGCAALVQEAQDELVAAEDAIATKLAQMKEAQVRIVGGLKRLFFHSYFCKI